MTRSTMEEGTRRTSFSPVLRVGGLGSGSPVACAGLFERLQLGGDVARRRARGGAVEAAPPTLPARPRWRLPVRRRRRLVAVLAVVLSCLLSLSLFYSRLLLCVSWLGGFGAFFVDGLPMGRWVSVGSRETRVPFAHGAVAVRRSREPGGVAAAASRPCRSLLSIRRGKEDRQFGQVTSEDRSRTPVAPTGATNRKRGTSVAARWPPGTGEVARVAGERARGARRGSPAARCWSRSPAVPGGAARVAGGVAWPRRGRGCPRRGRGLPASRAPVTDGRQGSEETESEQEG